MTPHTSTVGSVGILFASIAGSALGVMTTPPGVQNIDFFETNIRPIFAEHCLECHSAAKGKIKGGLNMDTRESLLKGGETGQALVPGNISSALIQAVEWSGDLQMPPKKKLSEEQIKSLKTWVEMGAPDPRESSATPAPSKRDHWAFQAVSRPLLPTVKNLVWGKNSIDKFILSKLEEKNLTPSEQPETGGPEQRRKKKEALLRRAYFDLVGIPPGPGEITSFVQDSSPNAFEKVVDRLLASTAYGERWGRHWLDTARYSDTSGNQRDRGDYRYAYAWTYRDWVISAINQDMPYDQFVLNQIAADKVPNNPKENLAALGFLTVGERFQNQDDILNERIDAVGRGLLGLTIACARCHDHKFDPITQADYYALKGVFASSVEPKQGPLIGGDTGSKRYQEFTQKLEALENKARATAFQLARGATEEFREKAALYFEAAYKLRRLKGDDLETRKANDLFIEQNALDRGIISQVQQHATLFDPILGPFIRLFESDGSSGKKSQKLAPNPLVSEFLTASGNSTIDLKSASALFEKFFRDKVTPATGERSRPDADPILDLRRGGIFKTIADPKTDTTVAAATPLMGLAFFPLDLVTGAEAVDLERIKAGFPNVRRNGALNMGLIFTKINELKLTFRGGEVRAMVMEDLPKPVDSPIFPRGNRPPRGETPKIIPRRFIEVLAEGGSPTPFKEGSGRLELARAIASKSNPLTARVLVNRVWMHHFGEGLVRTPDDLGNQSGTPTHPELLDFLASWFMEDYGASKPAWSVKALHKAIMLSGVYQQSSVNALLEQQKEVDAGNTLLWRSNVRRLDFEAFRDSLLTMAGTMDTTYLGPSVNLTSEPFSFRRSVYGYIDRANMPDLLMQFDMANPLEPNSKRTTSIVPQQALFLMNSPFTLAIVQRVVCRPELVDAVIQRRSVAKGIQTVFQIVLQRTPTREEQEMALQFLTKESAVQAGIKSATAQTTAAAQREAERKLRRDIENNSDTKAIVNEGTLVRRLTLTPWEALVQALMFCNEAAYLN